MPALAINTTANATNGALQVICAWPVSGQYGPGSRVLYYVLVAACVLAGILKINWIKNACLAATLLFPAVAAIHAVVLAALHRDDAIDMDIFGAFQLCSIGVLVAPITVNFSKTYFNDPGRNAIFIWATLILAGLLSLTVEFYRSNATDCLGDAGNRIPVEAKYFNYGDSCGLRCTPEDGPISPMRRGSANNIYVIPEPHKLTFGAGMLLAAACCIPAILMLVSMAFKIFEINWKMSRFGSVDEDLNANISGTNATVGQMKSVSSTIQKYVGVIAFIAVGLAISAILVIGELNFFSDPVIYQTEPIAAIGQWAPIAGTVLAIMGSLYLVLNQYFEQVKEPERPTTTVQVVHCHCGHSDAHIGPTYHSSGRESRSSQGDSAENTQAQMSQAEPAPARLHHMETADTIKFPTMDSPSQFDLDIRTTSSTADAGRRKVAKTFDWMSKKLGTAADDTFNDADNFSGKAREFPEIPGEQNRNPKLGQIREGYNQYRGSSPAPPRTRRGSQDADDLSMHRSRSRSPSGPRQSVSSDRQGHDRHESTASAASAASAGAPRTARRDTLTLPRESYRSGSRTEPPTTTAMEVPEGPRSPAIMVSQHHEPPDIKFVDPKGKGRDG